MGHRFGVVKTKPGCEKFQKGSLKGTAGCQLLDRVYLGPAMPTRANVSSLMESEQLVINSGRDLGAVGSGT